MSEKETPLKDSFVFYRSFANSIKRLPDDMQLALYQAITIFALDLIEPNFDDCQDKVFLEAIWDTIRPQLYANHKRYLNGCKGAEYGKLGGAPKGNQNARKDKQPQNNRKTTPNENENVNENVNNIDTPNCKRFRKPSIADIQEYCESNGFSNVEISSFYDYYESNGWVIGKSPMKVWKAAVMNWNRKRCVQNNES